METRETFSEFIVRRRRELDEQERELREKLAAISAERQQLLAAESIFLGRHTPATQAVRAMRKKKKGIRAGTIMDEVIGILKKYENGLSSRDILKAINDQRDEEFLARESLSPQLSRLKQAGYITLDGSVWKLAPPKKEEFE